MAIGPHKLLARSSPEELMIVLSSLDSWWRHLNTRWKLILANTFLPKNHWNSMDDSVMLRAHLGLEDLAHHRFEPSQSLFVGCWYWISTCCLTKNIFRVLESILTRGCAHHFAHLVCYLNWKSPLFAFKIWDLVGHYISHVWGLVLHVRFYLFFKV